MCYRIDRREQLLQVVRLPRRRLQAEANLRLYARINESCEQNSGLIVPRLDERAIIYRSPDWLVDTIAGPDCPIREADLAPNRVPACRQAVRVKSLCCRIAVVGRNVHETIAERRDFPRGLVKTDQLVGKHSSGPTLFYARQQVLSTQSTCSAGRVSWPSRPT